MSLLHFFGFATADQRHGNDGWPLAMGRRTSSGVSVTESTALNYSAVWAATRLLTATAACLPLNLYRRTGPKSREVASDHPLHRLLHNAPNDEMGSMMWRSSSTQQQINGGNCYAEIERIGSVVTALHPIHHSRVNVCRGTDGKLFYRVKNADGTHTDLPYQDVFHVPSMHSNDGIVGKGVVAHAREAIGMGQVVERQGAAYFKNGARPSVVIKNVGAKFLKDKDDRAEYRRMWAEKHGGPDNNGVPAILPEGADIANLSFNPEDSQFLETREHNINEIARWWGVPPHMIGDLRRATFSNIEAQSIDFVVYSLMWWLKLWEEEIWRKLLTKEEQKTYQAKHVVEGLLRGDSAARAAFYTSMFGIGVLSQNDIRELEDRNPVEGGDSYYVPLNMAPVGSDGASSIESPEGRQQLIEHHWKAIADNQQGLADSQKLILASINDSAISQASQFTRLLSQHTATIQTGVDASRKALLAKLDGFVTADDVNRGIDRLGGRFDDSRRRIDQQFAATGLQIETLASLHASKQQQALLYAQTVVNEAIGRMLAKECNAAKQAAGKRDNPADFFAWLDAYYETHEPKLREALSSPMATVAALLDTDTVSVIDYATAHCQQSHEDILQATEVAASEWQTVPGRIADVGEKWQQSRTQWSHQQWKLNTQTS